MQAQGGGLVDLAGALSGELVVGPVRTTSGTVPSGSGRTRTQTVTVTNVSTGPVTFAPAVVEPSGAGATFRASGGVVLDAGASTTLTLTLHVTRGAPSGSERAYLVLRSGSRVELAHAAVFAQVG